MQHSLKRSNCFYTHIYICIYNRMQLVQINKLVYILKSPSFFTNVSLAIVQYTVLQFFLRNLYFKYHCVCVCVCVLQNTSIQRTNTSKWEQKLFFIVQTSLV